MGQIIALDIGDKRIGVAVGDSQLKVAVPKDTIIRGNRDQDLRTIVHLLRREEAIACVLGLPRQADDSLGESAQKVLRLAGRLQKAASTPVYFVDEWETTREALDFLIEADVSRRRRRQVVDKLAATAILQRYFDRGPLRVEGWPQALGERGHD